MKGFDLRSSAVNLRSTGGSHRLKCNVPAPSRARGREGLILTSGDVVWCCGVVTKTQGNDEFV